MNHQDIQKKYISPSITVHLLGNLLSYQVSEENIVSVCRELYETHALRLKTIVAQDERNNTGGFVIRYIFGIPGERVFLAPFVRTGEKEEFPSLTEYIPEAQLYERKIQTFFGITPIGNPDNRPLLLHENWPADVFPLRKDVNGQVRPPKAATPYPFQKVEGEGIYEIPVGPIHAGIIEPGHFRFTVAGEKIILLEAKLGYKHKGSEKLFETFPLKQAVKLSERISGDSSLNHSLAFCQALETLAGMELPERAGILRVIFAELERIANHTSDIGFILMDTGFNFGGANGSRLREIVLQINARLTGSRFLRGLNILGGVTCDIGIAEAQPLAEDMKKFLRDFDEVITIALNSGTVVERLKDSGTVHRRAAEELGAVGIPARAAGIPLDARKDYPYAAYARCKIEPALEKTGDVYARFSVRVQEVRSSVSIINTMLLLLPNVKTPLSVSAKPFEPNACAVGITEGWRGDIVYFVATDSNGIISRVDVRDPSFLNWPVAAYSARGNVVPDFPLINKSFNLSYSGNDV